MTHSVVGVVKYAPKSYAHQKGLTCGEYNVRGILDGFSIPYQVPDSQRLRVSIFGLSFINDISTLLQVHGLSAPVRYASKLADNAKLKTVQDHIDKDEPVLLAIGNGHLSRNLYSPIARILIGHFITVYGYNTGKEIFYVYDPYLEGPYHEEIPVGNEVRTFGEFLRDWNGPFYYRFINMDHVYVPVSSK